MSTRIGIVGCGAVTQVFYVPALKTYLGERAERDVVVSAMFDPNDANRSKVARDFPLAAEVSSWEAFCDHPPDVAIIASPPVFHREQANDLLKRNVSVLCEKPLAANAVDARSIVETAKRHGSVLSVGMVRRYLPAANMIQRLLVEETFGRVQSVRFTEAKQFRWPVSSMRYFDKDVAAGGVLLDIGVHVLDLLVAWFGSLQLESYRDDSMGGLESNCVAMLRTDQEVPVAVRLSRDTDAPSGCWIECDRGVIHWRDIHATEVQILSRDTESPASPIGQLKNEAGPSTFERAFVSQLENVVAASRGTAALTVDPSTTLRALEIIDDCYAVREPMVLPWLSSVEKANAKSGTEPASANRTQNPNVGIVGASGFIGTRLVEWLHLNHDSSRSALPILRTPSSYARFSRFGIDARIADALDESALAQAFQGCDVVVHSAAGGQKLVERSVVSVYRAAEKANVRRLIYLSSASVYGPTPGEGTNESTPLHDRHEFDYCNWKVRAERKLNQLRKNGSVEVVILRPGIVLGPRSFWQSSFATSLVDDRAYVVNGGSGVCQSIYVDNLIHAILLAIDSAQADGQAYFVGDHERVTWRNVHEPIVSALGFDWSRVHDVPPRAAVGTWQARYERLRDSATAQSLLGYMPTRLRFAISEGVDTWFADPLNAMASFRETKCRLPQATREMSLLAECNTKLSYAKATKQLGYNPIVSFDEGVERTGRWLQFAGFQTALAEVRS